MTKKDLIYYIESLPGDDNTEVLTQGFDDNPEPVNDNNLIENFISVKSISAMKDTQTGKIINFETKHIEDWETPIAIHDCIVVGN